jgi:hypothetical protein
LCGYLKLKLDDFVCIGQVTINGHVVPGLNMSNISGMPPVSSRGPTPISEVGMPSNNRPQTPNLETLAGLLNRNNSSVLDTGNMEALGTFGLGASGGNITPNTGTLTPTCEYLLLHLSTILQFLTCQNRSFLVRTFFHKLGKQPCS